jgi:hypothetical protein
MRSVQQFQQAEYNKIDPVAHSHEVEERMEADPHLTKQVDAFLSSLQAAYLNVPPPRLYCFPSSTLSVVLKEKRIAGVTSVGARLLSINVNDVPIAYMHLLIYGLHFLLFDGSASGESAALAVLDDMDSSTRELYRMQPTATRIFLHDSGHPVRPLWPAFLNRIMKLWAETHRDNGQVSADLPALATDENTRAAIAAWLDEYPMHTHPALDVPFFQRDITLLPGFVSVVTALFDSESDGAHGADSEGEQLCRTYFSFTSPKDGVRLVGEPIRHSLRLSARMHLECTLHLFHDPQWRTRTRHPKTNEVLAPPPGLLRVALIIHIQRKLPRQQPVSHTLSYQLQSSDSASAAAVTTRPDALLITPLGGARFANRDRHVPAALTNAVPNLAKLALLSCTAEIQQTNDELLQEMLNIAQRSVTDALAMTSTVQDERVGAEGAHANKAAAAKDEENEEEVKEELKEDSDHQRKSVAANGCPLPDEKAERVASISRRLAARGLKRVVVPGDGNCFFHAIAAQLSAEHTATSLRAKVASFWRQPDTWPDEMVAQLVNDIGNLPPALDGRRINTPELYAQYIAQPNAYATDTDIGVLAHLCRVRIMLHVEDAPEDAEPAPYGEAARTIHLVHCGRLEEAESHFDGATPINGLQP